MKLMDEYSKAQKQRETAAASSSSSSSSSYSSSDREALERNHRFVLNEDDLASAALGQTWESRMAIKYYNRLYREYALADMSRSVLMAVGRGAARSRVAWHPTIP